MNEHQRTKDIPGEKVPTGHKSEIAPSSNELPDQSPSGLRQGTPHMTEQADQTGMGLVRAAVPSTDILQPAAAVKDEETPIPGGGGDPSITTPVGGEGDDGRRKRVISSATLLELTKSTLDDPMGLLWGYNLRPKAVTLLVGETSAGKTTLLHNLAYYLAHGEEFLGFQPPRPLRVLYLDYESGEQILAEHLSVIGTAEGWDFLNLNDVIRDQELTKVLAEEIKAGRYDVVIVDSLMEAYPVGDENDNSEGAKQMLKVRAVAHKTGAAILVVHNAGQKVMGRRRGTSVKNLARGASVRMDKADVVVNYTINGNKDSDERALEVVKTRGPNLNARMVIRFAGELGFEVLHDSTGGGGVVRKLEGRVLDLLGQASVEGEPAMMRSMILSRMGVEEDDRTGAQNVDRALRSLLTSGKVQRVKQGMYRLSEKSQQSSERAA